MQRALDVAPMGSLGSGRRAPHLGEALGDRDRGRAHLQARGAPQATTAEPRLLLLERLHCSAGENEYARALWY
jgi:hypothetical protein